MPDLWSGSLYRSFTEPCKYRDYYTFFAGWKSSSLYQGKHFGIICIFTQGYMHSCKDWCNLKPNIKRTFVVFFLNCSLVCHLFYHWTESYVWWNVTTHFCTAAEESECIGQMLFTIKHLNFCNSSFEMTKDNRYNARRPLTCRKIVWKS